MAGGMEFSFAVFPEPAALIKPTKGTFYDPTLRKDSKLMQVVAFDDLYISINGLFNSKSKGFAGIPTVAKNIYNPGQGSLFAFQHRKGAGLV